ncbi:MAG: SGNH/GDSL hydrolase family protein [Candidatus Thorarchaeota archaeon]
MKPDNPIRILCFGDSLTAGTPGYDPVYGGDLRFQYGYWLLRFAESFGVTNLSFRNHGVPGDLAAAMPDRLARALESGKYEVIIILAGSNDLGWNYPAESVHASLRRLWDIARSGNHALVTCTVPPIAAVYPLIQKGQRYLNRMILSNVSDERNTICVNVFAVLADERGLLPSEYDSGDGLHFSLKGYRRLGEVIWDEGVRRLLDD